MTAIARREHRTSVNGQIGTCVSEKHSNTASAFIRFQLEERIKGIDYRSAIAK
jgi:hypothetical protein